MNKRGIAVFLSMIVFFVTLASCGKSVPNETSTESSSSSTNNLNTYSGKGTTQKGLLDDINNESGRLAKDANTSNSTQANDDNSTYAERTENEIILEGADYVLIYNPLIYNQDDPFQMFGITSLKTGNLSGRIYTGYDKADDMLDSVDIPVVLSQEQLKGPKEFDDLNRESSKEDVIPPIYQKGSKHDFYIYVDESLRKREKSSFSCVYEGESCYIWSVNDSVSEEQAEELGKEFDTTVYPRDTEAFGRGRFTDNGGKVSILMYPMWMEGLGGFFTGYDIYSSYEVSEEEADRYGLNLDHAIININSKMLAVNMSFVKSTLAHEYQHLICRSDCFYFEKSPIMRVWLNEAMSAYAEDMIYPGIKNEGYYNIMMYASDNFTRGQSLYNFDITNDPAIGAYGAVYLFSKYLSEQAGEDVFTNVHDFWRTSFREDIDEADALAASVSDEFYQEIDQKFEYPDQIKNTLNDPESEWMSKLTLAFYLETLSGKLAGLDTEYEAAMRRAMLYRSFDSQEIQGGGRMIVKTLNGSFSIPQDADNGLIYIGLDENFQPISDMMIIGG